MCVCNYVTPYSKGQVHLINEIQKVSEIFGGLIYFVLRSNINLTV